MSARLLSSRSTLQAIARNPQINISRRFAPYATATNTAGGLLRANPVVHTRRPTWPQQINRYHNSGVLVVARHMSFARSLPKLFLKFAKLPAAFGGATIAAFGYIQYQANQGVAYAKDLVNSGLNVASTTFDGAKKTVNGVYTSAQEGLDKLGLPEVPEWMHNILKFGEKEGKQQSEGEGDDGNNSGGPGGKGPQYAATGAATAAAFGYGSEDERSGAQQAKDDQMMVLTRKMIEIRNILTKVGQTAALQLPSIVVIGSQSSGKSSVLEAIVGHEFLPKGSNMVTRRPIELTLINTPGSTAEYGEFPALNMGKMTDFSTIQKTLTELNLAVPEEDCVSDDPIQLNIYSPNVPDLSLIDLPGYIQVSSEGQPPELKEKIAELCERYIKPPNVILAISAADVDLANSTALRASRRVDPRGERTIGVITKMDLVEPSRGYAILKDKNYPLRLGYVGVVCKSPGSAKYFFGKNANISGAIIKNENAFFNAHPEFGPDTGAVVGTVNLRQKLMNVLEQTMASSLQGTSDAIHQELEEATYEFKVHYNDRHLTAETYLAESLDRFKHSFKDFTQVFGRPQVRELLKRELDQKVLDFLAQRYWNKPLTDEPYRPRRDEKPLTELPTAEPDNMYWQRKLDASTSQLTKLGFGRLATNVVANALAQHMDRLVSESTFREHPFAKKAISDATNTILNERFYSTSDQVENCIKPYKYEIEVEDREWAQSRDNSQKLLKEELKACEEAYKALGNSVGKKKLAQAMTFVDRQREAPRGAAALEGTDAFGFSHALLERAREGVFLRDRSALLKMRLYAIKSKQCGNKANKYYCPEVFLDVVAEKLTSTAVLFLNVELLSEFYYHFPRELDNRLGRHLSPEQVDAIAREDPKIRKHIDLQQRKQLLELALEKMDSLMALEKSKKAAERSGQQPQEEVPSRWGRIF